MNEIIVKKDKITVNLEWSYSNDQELIESIRNAQELIALIDKDNEQEQETS